VPGRYLQACAVARICSSEDPILINSSNITRLALLSKDSGLDDSGTTTNIPQRKVVLVRQHGGPCRRTSHMFWIF
jgi:hypothetical protein